MARPRYEILEHTADIGITAYADTISAAFENAAYGMYELMCDTNRVEPRERIDITLFAADTQGLLVDWLNELLFLTDARDLLFSRFVVAVEGSTLNAEAYGERFDPARHERREEIKACTYHLLDVERDESGYRATVVFDV